MKKKFLLLGALFVCLCSRANNTPYAASAIPAELLVKSNVVKRMEDIRFEVISTGETILKKKYALTILNETGDNNAVFVEYYDKLRQIRSIEGSLFDATGKLVKKLKTKDVLDVSAVDDNNLMDDDRKMVHHFYYKVYPYTVEYEVDIKYNNSLFFPFWVPQEDEEFSVQSSQFSIVTPANYQFRFRSFNYKGDPVTRTENNKTISTWQVSNQPSFKVGYAAPYWSELTTMVYFAPTDFEVEGYKGNMSSWQEFGKFQYELKKGRDVLPATVADKVQQLIAGAADDKEKIKRLYHFLQQNTRYISIQLGIGGWQPFDAAYVAKKGYGDCKALTNYMFSLLKAANIKSYYALVKAGGNKNVLEDFPSQQFNHVILCVPLQKDTVWLECTSQTLPAGYVSNFTANRKALLIDETGGKLISTPRYGLKENMQTRFISGKLEADGTLATTIDTRYKAMQQDGLHQMLSQLSKDKVQKVLREELDLATYELQDFTYEESKGDMPEVKEKLNISISKYATITGKRLFITPNLLNRSTRQLKEDEARKHDFYFDAEYHDADSVEIELPEGYEPEAMPKEVNVQTKFGSYSSTVKLVNNKLIYHRVYNQFSGRFPASDGAELAKFYAAIYKADRNRVVLVKKEI